MEHNRHVNPEQPHTNPFLRYTTPLDFHKLEAFLNTHMRGQNRAISKVVKSLTRALTTTRHPRKPLSVFVFTGGTGIGKTELARQLSLFYHAPIRLFDISKICRLCATRTIEATAYEHSACPFVDQLTHFVTENPASVVVFAGLEKLDSYTFDRVLRLAEAGIFVDDNNRPVSLRNCIVILTITAFVEEANHGQNSPDQEPHASIDEILVDHIDTCRIELDNVIMFEELSQSHFLSITCLELMKIKQCLVDNGYVGEITFSPDTVFQILRSSDTHQDGAHSLTETICQDIVPLIAGFINSSSNPKAYALHISYDQNGHYFQYLAAPYKK